jgi:glycerophosphoryl diester phosphodiesterase
MSRNLLLIVVLGFIITSCSVSDDKLEIVVHRGANKRAPENTLAATQKCIELGVEYVEIDVRMSKDCVFYLLHDKTLDRTTNGSGPINEMLSTQIDQLDAGSWFSNEFAGEKVPRLEEYLNEINGEVKIYFDVKTPEIKGLVALVYKIGMQNDCFFWFANNKRAKEFRELEKDIALKMSVKEIGDMDSILDYDPQLIECKIDLLTPQVITFCQKNNLKIMVNALDKNGDQNYQQIIDSPADMVNLDRPEDMIKLMK